MSNQYTIIVGLAILTGVLLVFGLPGSSDTSEPTDSQASTSSVASNSKQVTTESSTTFDQIKTTDGKKHLIPLADILDGGPGKDGIPSIDDPQFVRPDEAEDWLTEDARGIGVTIDGDTRFYPYTILVWHEIVNDTVGGQPATITYCPLCKTGIVFDPVVDGERLEFGVSGKLWKSNLLMYNRTGNPQTESYWSQVLGQAVVGPATGRQLDTLPSSITTLSKWKENHPDTKVLAQPEDSLRNYGSDPYDGYYSSDRVSFGASFADDRLDPKRLVYGVVVNDQAKAYPADRLAGSFSDTVGGQKITVTQSADDSVQFTADGERLDHVTGFWFSWASIHPDSEIYQSN